MTENCVTCAPNALGRLFEVKHIALINNELVVYDGEHEKRFPVSDLKAFPYFRKGWLGGNLILYFADKSIALRLLSNKVLPQLKRAIHKVISANACLLISAVWQRFENCVIKNYLRDSQIKLLEAEINKVLHLYTPLLDKPDSLADKQLQQLRILQNISPLSESAASLRKRFEQSRLASRSGFFDHAETYPLTEQQRLAIIRNNDRNLVLAAAGTGKTSVIVAKVLDLIETHRADPDTLLILAYNNAAAKELKARIENRALKIGIPYKHIPQVLTFHGLGRQILSRSGVPAILSPLAKSGSALEAWATDWFSNAIQHSEHSLKIFIKLLCSSTSAPYTKTSTGQEVIRNRKLFCTLNGEHVSHYHELLIANWLYLYCVPYQYKPAASDTRCAQGYCRSCFHLSETDIVVKYAKSDTTRAANACFTADHTNNTQAPSESTHFAKRSTLHVIVFHTDVAEGNVESTLETQLNNLGINLSLRPSREVIHALHEFAGFSNVVKRYIKCLQAIRTGSLSPAETVRRLHAHDLIRADDYADLLTAFVKAYKTHLRKESHIDFDDMIIRATECVASGEHIYRYRHILVDEFQDISEARMAFLNALINKSDRPMLTAVGDDWQSIYRFSGSNLALMTRFTHYQGTHSLTTLEKTFRYNNSIAHTAGAFIMKNPEQFKKTITTHQTVAASQVYLLDDIAEGKINLPKKTRQIIDRVSAANPDGSIAILARYNHLLEEIKAYLEHHTTASNINFWTFHSAKGLEADYCIVIGLSDQGLSFPAKQQDEILVEALLCVSDNYLYAEERRLFYVALTRAKHKCYLIADSKSPSAFTQELLADEFNVNIATDAFIQGE